MIHFIAGVSAFLQAGLTIALSGHIVRSAIARRRFHALINARPAVADAHLLSFQPDIYN